MSKFRFKNKKLLMLGSNVSAVDMVHYAREHGAYTIVADFYPPERSKAKLIADEHVLISTDDLNELSCLIEQRGISGVLAGIDEFNLLNAMKLCQLHGLPFYCTQEQWNDVAYKDRFRALCLESGIPTPYTYFTGGEIPDDLWNRIHYPVVVKPVDGSASVGVYICKTEHELRVCKDLSRKESRSERIIIEEYIHGDEFTAHYTIVDGKPRLACVDNRYPITLSESDVTTIPIARTYPATFTEDFIHTLDGPIKQMCRTLNLVNSILFVQGIQDPQTNKFYIFEAGLRCAGEAPYRFLKKINGLNFIEILVDHALLNKTTYNSILETPFLDGKYCGIISFASTGGKVGRIQGLEQALKALPRIVEHEVRYQPGMLAPSGNTLRQLLIRFVIICDNYEEMRSDIEILNNLVHVFREDGSEMALKFSPDKLPRR